jgi:2-enoate reductase
MALTAPLAMLAKNKVLNTLASPIIDAEYLTAAPSVLPNRWADDVTTREITVKEIHDIIYAFGETARLCKEAGVDGMEVHAVHEGYLLD